MDFSSAVSFAEVTFNNPRVFPASGAGSLWVCEGAFDALALGLGRRDTGAGLRSGC